MKRHGTTRTRRIGRTPARPARDEESYVFFSYARNSCSRNHRRYTLCGSHATEEHAGPWQTCKKCRGEFETELYVYYGTNDFNFVKLADPPSFEPTLCARCRRRIRLGDDGYTTFPDGRYFCERCADAVDRDA